MKQVPTSDTTTILLRTSTTSTIVIIILLICSSWCCFVKCSLSSSSLSSSSHSSNSNTLRISPSSSSSSSLHHHQENELSTEGHRVHVEGRFVGESATIPCDIDDRCGPVYLITWSKYDQVVKQWQRVYLYSESYQTALGDFANEDTNKDNNNNNNNNENNANRVIKVENSIINSNYHNGTRLVISNFQSRDESLYKCDVTYVQGSCPSLTFTSLVEFVTPGGPLLRVNGKSVDFREDGLEGISSSNSTLTVTTSSSYGSPDSHNFNSTSNGHVTKVGPFDEGSTIVLECSSTGGRPIPEVKWYNSSRLMKSKISISTTDSDQSITTVTSTIRLIVTRRDLNSIFECHVSNNATQHRQLVKSIAIDVRVKPVSLKIVGPIDPVVSGEMVSLTCSVEGARPSATIDWFNRSELVDPQPITMDNVMDDGTFRSSSSLVFIATRFDHDREFSCMGTNEVLKDRNDVPLLESTKLKVLYPPECRVKLLPRDSDGHSKLECRATSSPPITSFKWAKFNDRTNETTIVSEEASSSNSKAIEQSSILLVRHSESSRHNIESYSCIANNMMGSTTCRLESKSLQVTFATGEDANIPCEVDLTSSSKCGSISSISWSFKRATNNNSSSSGSNNFDWKEIFSNPPNPHNRNININEKFVIDIKLTSKSFRTSPTNNNNSTIVHLGIKKVSKSDEGTYKCHVFYTHSSSSSSSNPSSSSPSQSSSLSSTFSGSKVSSSSSSSSLSYSTCPTVTIVRLHVTDPPRPPSLKINKIATNSVTISWKVNSADSLDNLSNNDKINSGVSVTTLHQPTLSMSPSKSSSPPSLDVDKSGFIISYRAISSIFDQSSSNIDSSSSSNIESSDELDHEWKSIRVSSRHRSYTITNLVCLTKYVVKISSFNEIILGDWSDEMKFSTEGRLPIVPPMTTTNEFIKPNLTSVDIDHARTCPPIDHFELKIKPKTSNEWALLTNSSSQLTDSVISIHELAPSTTYDFNVIAKSKSGKNLIESNYVFSTLSSDQWSSSSMNGQSNKDNNVISLSPKLLSDQILGRTPSSTFDGSFVISIIIPSICVIILIVMSAIGVYAFFVKKKLSSHHRYHSNYLNQYGGIGESRHPFTTGFNSYDMSRSIDLSRKRRDTPVMYISRLQKKLSNSYSLVGNNDTRPASEKFSLNSFRTPSHDVLTSKFDNVVEVTGVVGGGTIAPSIVTGYHHNLPSSVNTSSSIVTPIIGPPNEHIYQQPMTMTMTMTNMTTNTISTSNSTSNSSNSTNRTFSTNTTTSSQQPQHSTTTSIYYPSVINIRTSNTTTTGPQQVTTETGSDHYITTTTTEDGSDIDDDGVSGNDDRHHRSQSPISNDDDETSCHYYEQLPERVERTRHHHHQLNIPLTTTRSRNNNNHRQQHLLHQHRTLAHSFVRQHSQPSSSTSNFSGIYQEFDDSVYAQQQSHFRELSIRHQQSSLTPSLTNHHQHGVNHLMLDRSLSRNIQRGNNINTSSSTISTNNRNSLLFRP